MATVNGSITHEAGGFETAQAEARAARGNVAVQLSELIEQTELTGSRDLFVLRLKRLIEAERGDDEIVLRSAKMELAHVVAAWVVSDDLGQ